MISYVVTFVNRLAHCNGVVQILGAKATDVYGPGTEQFAYMNQN